MTEVLIDVPDDFYIEFQQGVRKQLNVPDDWHYHASASTEAAVEEMLDILGEDEHVYVSGSVFRGTHRFSIFYSPVGRQRLIDWATAKHLIK